MSLTCELSGEPLAATKETIVTTPSGHICLKRLLLQKLTENGGMDPFETIRERPLSEDQLVELKMKLEPPPRPQVTSLPNLLQMIQTEYDALVLELFDTRKALEETRRELSQALYQNDAAVRVVARLSMERDAAREELQRWSASAAPATTTTPLTDGVAADKEEPQAKRRKVERTTGPLSNDLPEDDVNAMVEMWNYLHTQRKPKLKAAAAKAPTADVVATYASKGTQNWHKATCRSLLCMMSRGDLLVTGGKDKQVVVYSLSEEVVKQSFNLGSVPNCVDASDSLVVAASAKGPVVVYSVADGSSMGEITVDSTEVVAVNLHPTGNHMCVLTADGRLLVCLVEEGKVSTVSEFKVDTPPEYTCGALHPDGLLYAAGTSTGEIHMWDFKSKTLASTMKEGDGDDPISTLAFSENGYHLATGHHSGTVRFWDLRKQRTIATMNGDGSLLETVTSVAFDESGKFAAFGGKGGLVVTTVKEWGATASIKTGKPISGVGWTQTGIATCSDKERAISFYGTP